MNLEIFLGASALDLLATVPFSGWAVERAVDRDLPRPEVRYVFRSHGLDLICHEDERIRSIFVHRGADEALTGVPFTLGRQQVLARFGRPEKSGARFKHPILGVKGAWDRFHRPTGLMHVQYQTERDEIQVASRQVVYESRGVARQGPHGRERGDTGQAAGL
ncbi:MAG: hypothetical protein ACK41F_12185 [Fimbriimonadaceae bacterium]